jgi:vacuolar-type H+-ATPase subunit I/STV1
MKLKKEKVYQFKNKCRQKIEIEKRIKKFIKDKFDDVEIVISKDLMDLESNELQIAGFDEFKLELDEDNLDEQLLILEEKINQINREIKQKEFCIKDLN